MDNLGEHLGVDAAADVLGRRVRVPEFGEAVFDVFEFAHERVELGIGDGRGVLDVVALAVLLDLQRQFLGACPGGVEFASVRGGLGDVG